LILWVLDWVAFALSTSPTSLFDPPVNYPVPKQLAGSEHFLSAQALFLPLRWLTGDSFVAANLTAFLYYPLAGAAMHLLLRTLGFPRSTALVGGLVYAFGYTAAPGRLHVLQSQHLYLPLAAFALRRLRDQPTWRRAGVLCAILGAGFFSSYHMAVYLGLFAVLWGFAELLRPVAGRLRFVVRAAVAAGLTAIALIVASRPYFARPEATGAIELAVSPWGVSHLDVAAEDQTAASPAALLSRIGACVVGCGFPPLCEVDRDESRREIALEFGEFGPILFLSPALVLVGVASAFGRDRGRRRLVTAAIVIALAGATLAGFAHLDLGDVRVPLPRAWLEWTPARFIRIPGRALVLTFFGATLVAATGLRALQARLGRRGAAALALAVAVATVLRVPAGGTVGATLDKMGDGPLARWSRFSPLSYTWTPTIARDRRIYGLVADQVRATGSGPLLEMPSRANSPSTVVGQMTHRQPSVRFYTGYAPAHLLLIDDLVARLPDRRALDDLVDMTGLRWILLRPPLEWADPQAYQSFMHALQRNPRTRSLVPIEDFVLVELDPTSRHPAWFTSLSAGLQSDRTVLGTPLVLLPRGRGAVSAKLPSTMPAGRLFRLSVSVTNHGWVSWPAVLPRREVRSYVVQVESRWIAQVEGAADASPPRVTDLRRDVAPGETVEQTMVLAAPRVPGKYELELAVRQVDGSDLASPTNPIRLPLEVVARE
ncbi:MAG: hypothetical protein ACREQL_14135, partial [Candidatus Binatia bacterium]